MYILHKYMYIHVDRCIDTYVLTTYMYIDTMYIHTYICT